MRLKKSLKNILFNIGSQIIIIILSFISRKIFIDKLGSLYLGVDGIILSLISLLSIIESGVGTAITYNLYEPLAKKQIDKIKSLMCVYKKIYRCLGLLITCLGIICYPLLKKLIGDEQRIEFLFLVYILIILKNTFTYFNAHKFALINSDQNGYKLKVYNVIFIGISTLAKIIVLKLTQDYTLYLTIDLLFFTSQNIYMGLIVERLYPYLKSKEILTLDKKIYMNIKNNTKAMFLHKIGSFFVFGTDNILISKYISIIMVGYYSNYIMIVGQIGAIFGIVISSLSSSVGNLIILENNSKKYSLFKIIFFINFWIFSSICIILNNLISPFIKWWIGDSYVLEESVVLIILLNFYITQMRSAGYLFKSGAGIFQEDKFFPLIESGVNLICSLILVKNFGLKGILLGTTLSSLAVPFWTQPYLIYKIIFKKSFYKYLYRYLLYTLIFFIVGAIINVLSSYLINDTIFNLIINGMLYLIVINIIYIILFYRTKEFQYIYKLVVDYLSRIRQKNKEAMMFNLHKYHIKK